MEYNFTFQMGPRGGVKVALGEGLALDVGLNLPLLASYEGLPLAADLGLLVGAGPFYLSPRLHGLAFRTTDSRYRSFGFLLYQLNLGYQAEPFLIEIGGLGGIEGALLVNFSAGLRF
ncbi:hypothetical protein DV704_07935 [Meiothermus sp. QL-1]|uniref:hypothetical protein n=1 Tax=Meiothermus sp. QL-1 TaxID=2058095 RepID=UPI000E0B949F|nr:hypothetical protein [Meiothermus sp. QL-1]RDI95232.1 hypothetical protein DV704_07935 [Meiothermus sp. QL-1]